jgi:hypothetical protein
MVNWLKWKLAMCWIYIMITYKAFKRWCKYRQSLKEDGNDT